VQAGVDLPTVQRISGHRTLAMVLRYAHVSAPHIDAAITALETSTTPKLHQAPLAGSRP
jgi:site-specific recombinase XerD